jgi:hypothetical protein
VQSACGQHGHGRTIATHVSDNRIRVLYECRVFERTQSHIKSRCTECTLHSYSYARRSPCSPAMNRCRLMGCHRAYTSVLHPYMLLLMMMVCARIICPCVRTSRTGGESLNHAPICPRPRTSSETGRTTATSFTNTSKLDMHRLSETASTPLHRTRLVIQKL